MKNLLKDFNAKEGIENIFKPITGNECLHQENNVNGIIIAHFAMSKNLVFKSTIFSHRDIQKSTWTSPGGKNHNQISYILIDMRWNSTIQDVRSYWGGDRDTDH